MTWLATLQTEFEIHEVFVDRHDGPDDVCHVLLVPCFLGREHECFALFKDRKEGWREVQMHDGEDRQDFIERIERTLRKDAGD
jgi:hypothetical protein